MSIRFLLADVLQRGAARHHGQPCNGQAFSTHYGDKCALCFRVFAVILQLSYFTTVFHEQTSVHATKSEILDAGNFRFGVGKFTGMAQHAAAFIDIFQVEGRGDKALFHHIGG